MLSKENKWLRNLRDKRAQKRASKDMNFKDVECFTEKRWMTVVSPMGLENFLFRLQYDTGVKWGDGDMPCVDDIEHRLSSGGPATVFLFGEQGMNHLSTTAWEEMISSYDVGQRKVTIQGESGPFEVLKDTLFIDMVAEELKL